MANRFGYKGGEHDTWLASLTEETLEPDLRIIDAHHHLWIRDGSPYLLREFGADLATGHNIVGTVYAECHSMYRTHGPVAEQPIGEMEFVAGMAAMSASEAFGTSNVCTAAVGSADLTLGHAAKPILEGLQNASGGRFRGVRASTCWHSDEKLHNAAPHEGFLLDSRVVASIECLAELGLSLDVWCYHTQLDEILAISELFPALTIIINHTGTPILGGPYRNELEQVRKDWQTSLLALSQHPNLFVKLGALPAKFGSGSQPPSSQTIADAWAPWIEPCIEMFGAERCFFESNFPVHKNWMSYPILWNAFKLITQGASAVEKNRLFSNTAAEVYKIDTETTISA